MGDVSWNDFDSGFVDVTPHAEIPELSELEQARRVLFDPDKLKVGTVPSTAFPYWSLSVMMTLQTSVPFALQGPFPTIDDEAIEAGPCSNTTLSPTLRTGDVISKTFVSAFVDFRVQVEIPEELVAVHNEIVLEVPLALKTGV
jgi:hypothetical protein